MKKTTTKTIEITELKKTDSIKSEDITSLEEFLKTNITSYTIYKYPIVKISHKNINEVSYFIINNNKIYEINYLMKKCFEKTIASKTFLQTAFNHIFYTITQFKKEKILLLNGDNDSLVLSADYRPELNNIKHITVSFTCLGNMFLDAKILNNSRAFVSHKHNSIIIDAVCDKIANKDITIIDYKEDKYIKISNKDKEQIKLIKKKNQNPLTSSLIKPPEFGFSLVLMPNNHYKWHQAAWVCLKDKKNNYYIMGQDEGSYFCSQLPKTNIKNMTVETALKTLIPKEAHINTPRQGEWFAIPINEKDIPKITNCIAFGDHGDSSITLPVETTNSNHHELIPNDRNGIFIIHNGIIYVKDCVLYHTEHTDLLIKEWSKLVRNTAVRSVSVQGVD